MFLDELEIYNEIEMKVQGYLTYSCFYTDKTCIINVTHQNFTWSYKGLMYIDTS